MKLKIALSLLFVLLTSPAGMALAATYYVNAGTGNNANAGTQTAPWLTLQYAADKAAAGDTVLVAGGTYQPFHITKSGTTTNRITFQVTGGTALINGYESYDGRYAGITVLGDNVTIDGFTVAVGATSNATKSRGIRISGTSTTHRKGVIIKNNKVSNAGWVGITTSFSEGILLEKNEVWGSKGQHGIYIANSADYPIARGNIIHDNIEAGIQINADKTLGGDGVITGALFEYNVMYNNGANCCGAIELDGVVQSTIKNNILYNNKTSGINNYVGDGAQPSNSNRMVNNTIVMASGSRHGISLRSGAVNSVIKNNIIIQLGTGDSISVDTASMSGLDSNYNVLTRIDSAGSMVSLGEWQSARKQDLKSFTAVSADLFTNAAQFDYSLKPTSPAIDKGTALTEVTVDFTGTPRPQGAAYDIGGHEFKVAGGGTDTTPPVPPANLRFPAQQ